MFILAEIRIFLPKLCFINLRQLSVNRNSVSVNFAKMIYGRTLQRSEYGMSNYRTVSEHMQIIAECKNGNLTGVKFIIRHRLQMGV